jgi:hypothetical protein
MAHNSAAVGALYAGYYVGALHNFTASALEFRRADGSLGAFCTTSRFGSWVGLTIYAARPELRCGIWLCAFAFWMERLLSDERIALLDIGPSMAELKQMSGLQLLPPARALAAAAFG